MKESLKLKVNDIEISCEDEEVTIKYADKEVEINTNNNSVWVYQDGKTKCYMEY